MPARDPAALAANQRACDAIDERRFVEAIEPAEEATRLDPEWSAPWWNLAVAYKHACRWHDCLAACERVIGLVRDDDLSGLYWSAAIAATALGDWARARDAWRAAGITLPAGDGAIHMELGPTPVRIGGPGEGEVLWCDRIDPCRAVIVSVPLPSSGRRCGDLLLHDGEPRGKRMLGDQKVSVFDELAVLQTSEWGTWEVTIEAASPAVRDELLARLEGGSVRAEDWTESVHFICTACSLGEPGHHHDHDALPSWQTERRIGVAAASEDELRPLRGLLGRWRKPIVSVQRVL